MIKEEDIQKAKDATFPIPEGGRSYEQALAASGFELGAHFVMNRLKSDGYSDETHWKPSDEQKQEWSEEDKDFMYDTLSNLTELKDRYGEGYGNVGKCINWLKSIKDRVQPKPQQKWSEEDENMANDLIEGLLSSEKTHYLVHTSKEIVDWLKSLKCRMQGKEEKK